MDKKYKTLFKNTSWIVLGGALTKLFSIVMLPFYTRWLTVTDYGTTDIITVYVSLLTGVSSLCIGEAMFVFPKNASFENQKSYYSSAISFTFGLFIPVAIFFYIVREFLIHIDSTIIFVPYCWYIYCLILTSFLQIATQQFAIAINALKIYSFTSLVYVISLAILSFLLIPKYKVDGYIYSMIIANIISILYTFIFSKNYLYYSVKRISWRTYRELIRYSIPLIPNSIMWWLVSSLNRPLLETEVGLFAVGLFAVANKFPTVISMVAQYFSSSFNISVFEEYGSKDFSAFFNRILRSVFLLLIIIAGVITLFSRQLIMLFSTVDYYTAYKYIPILALGVIYNVISGLICTVYSVTKQSKYFFYSSLFAALTSLALNFMLIPILGLWGAAISVLCSFIVMSMTRYICARRMVQFTKLKSYLIISLLYLAFCIQVINLDNILINSFVFVILMIAVLYRNSEINMLFASYKTRKDGFKI